MPGKGRQRKKNYARHGTGSIRWNEKRKCYEGKVRLGKDADGKPIRRTFRGPTMEAVQQQINDARAKVLQGIKVTPTSLTVKDHFQEWLAEKARKTRPNTMSKYRGHVERHIIPALGRIKLTDLNYIHVNRFFEMLEAKTKEDGSAALAASTRTDIARVLSMGLNDAVRKGLIADNPVHKVEGPEYEDSRPRFLTPEEWKRWREAAAGERLELFYAVAFHTGMRPSELLGLPWENVDLERRRIKIAQALHEDGSRIWIGPLKTESSYRTISIGKEAVSALKRQRVLQLQDKLKAGANWKRPSVAPGYSNNLVFATETGKWLRRSTIYKYDLARVRERSGLHDVGLHTFRHTHVAVLIHMGARPLDIKERLGHKDVSFTLQRYGHLFPGDDERTAQLMDAFAEQLAAED